MQKYLFQTLLVLLCMLSYVSTPEALGGNNQTVIYTMTHHSAGGELISYTTYNIADHTKTGYWLQRTVSIQPDSNPLSTTQTLLSSDAHKPLRYIMYRPANMSRPANVIDLPLAKMGKDEILPTPITEAFAEAGQLATAAGRFDVKQGQQGDFTFWVSPDVPVLGVVKVETPEWTMELFRIDPKSVDLLPKKPEKGGIAYMEEE